MGKVNYEQETVQLKAKVESLEKEKVFVRGRIDSLDRILKSRKTTKDTK